MNEIELLFHTIIQIKSKCIKDFNITPETLKL